MESLRGMNGVVASSSGLGRRAFHVGRGSAGIRVAALLKPESFLVAAGCLIPVGRWFYGTAGELFARNELVPAVASTKSPTPKT